MKVFINKKQESQAPERTVKRGKVKKICNSTKCKHGKEKGKEIEKINIMKSLNKGKENEVTC